MQIRPLTVGRHVTVARRVDGGWECVDDQGRRLVVADHLIDPALRTLRVGQRLALRGDAAGSASLP